MKKTCSGILNVSEPAKEKALPAHGSLGIMGEWNAASSAEQLTLSGAFWSAHIRAE